MARRQREKGARGEREVAHLIFDELGLQVSRNLEQARSGGADIELPPLRIEVKRRARIGNLYVWLEQAARACLRPGDIPAVFCRADGQDWLCVLPARAALAAFREEVS